MGPVVGGAAAGRLAEGADLLAEGLIAALLEEGAVGAGEESRAGADALMEVDGAGVLPEGSVTGAEEEAA